MRQILGGGRPVVAVTAAPTPDAWQEKERIRRVTLRNRFNEHFLSVCIVIGDRHGIKRPLLNAAASQATRHFRKELKQELRLQFRRNHNLPKPFLLIYRWAGSRPLPLRGWWSLQFGARLAAGNDLKGKVRACRDTLRRLAYLHLMASRLGLALPK